MIERKSFNMIPPNILLSLGTTPNPPKAIMPNLPKYARPLDAWQGEPYLGEIRFNTQDLKCYRYTEIGWEEIR